MHGKLQLLLPGPKQALSTKALKNVNKTPGTVAALPAASTDPCREGRNCCTCTQVSKNFKTSSIHSPSKAPEGKPANVASCTHAQQALSAISTHYTFCRQGYTFATCSQTSFVNQKILKSNSWAGSAPLAGCAAALRAHSERLTADANCAQTGSISCELLCICSCSTVHAAGGESLIACVHLVATANPYSCAILDK